MFYSDFVLSKKGPLARIWLAAHWDKKLTKAQIFETNIESSIEKILRPKMKLALRTSGHLMLGVVRIYSRKTKYLLADCNEAFVKIKMAFRPGMVDLPDDHREAAANAVTLPEVFHDFDAVMPDLNNLDIEVQFNLNQSRADEITMREDYGSVLPLNTEDTFDLGFDVSSSEVLRHSVGFDQSAHQDNLLFGEGIDSGERNKSTDMNPSLELMSMDVDLPKDDGFGAISGAGAGLFEGGLFEDAPMPSLYFNENKGTNVIALPSTSREQEESRLNENDDFDDNFGALSPSRQSSIGSPSHSPCPDEDLNEALRSSNSQGVISEEPMEPTLEPTNSQSIDEHQNAIPQNEEESFALAPVNTSTLVGSSKTRRKRKLIVDEVKNLSGEEMKGQLSDTTDIVTTLDLAPPTKRLMRWKETGGVEKLFTLSGKMIPSTILYKNYQRHLVSMNASNEDPKSGDAGSKEIDDDGVFVVPTVQLPLKRGRKRKRPAVEESTQDIVLENQNANQFQFGYSEELPDSMESKMKAENHASLKHENDQNKRFQSSYDTSISNSETNSKQYSDENNHLNSGMNPWYTAEYNNSQNKMQNEIAEGYSVPVAEDAINLQNNDENASIKDVASSWQNTEYNAENQNTNVYSSPGSNVDHAMTPCTNLDNSITPWHDVDYFNPLPDETPEQQGDNETMEQFEERILNKRASHLYSTIRIRISTGIMTTLNDLTIGNVKKQVAQKFYSLLVLKKHKVLELTQETPYDEVLLSKGTNFDDPKL